MYQYNVVNYTLYVGNNNNAVVTLLSNKVTDVSMFQKWESTLW